MQALPCSVAKEMTDVKNERWQCVYVKKKIGPNFSDFAACILQPRERWQHSGYHYSWEYFFKQKNNKQNRGSNKPVTYPSHTYPQSILLDRYMCKNQACWCMFHHSNTEVCPYIHWCPEHSSVLSSLVHMCTCMTLVYFGTWTHANKVVADIRWYLKLNNFVSKYTYMLNCTYIKRYRRYTYHKQRLFEVWLPNFHKYSMQEVTQ